jgi:WD40 repeat protein
MQIRTFLTALLLVHSAYAQPAERPKANRPRDATVQPGQPLPTGMSITPAAAPGSQFLQLYQNLTKPTGTLSGQPVSTAISPDGNTLVVLTSGYNGTEEVFIYDVSNNTPMLKQYLPVGSAFMGLAWNPRGTEFYVSGGSKDLVYVYSLQSGKFAVAAQIPLGHSFGLGLLMVPTVAGLAVNAKGDTLVAVNYLNDSISWSTSSRVRRRQKWISVPVSWTLRRAAWPAESIRSGRRL